MTTPLSPTLGQAEKPQKTAADAGTLTPLANDSREQSGHTPGEWKVDPASPYQVAHGYSTVAEAAMTYGLQRAIANAKLIAAAPDLLEACELAKQHLVTDLVEPGRTGVLEIGGRNQESTRPVLDV